MAKGSHPPISTSEYINAMVRIEQLQNYTRRLEDACLILWSELPVAETRELGKEMPDLMDFLAHLHLHIDHEQAMVRRSSWIPVEEDHG